MRSTEDRAAQARPRLEAALADPRRVGPRRGGPRARAAAAPDAEPGGPRVACPARRSARRPDLPLQPINAHRPRGRGARNRYCICTCSPSPPAAVRSLPTVRRTSPKRNITYGDGSTPAGTPTVRGLASRAPMHASTSAGATAGEGWTRNLAPGASCVAATASFVFLAAATRTGGIPADLLRLCGRLGRSWKSLLALHDSVVCRIDGVRHDRKL